MRVHFQRYILGALLIPFACISQADIQPAKIFSDHMVLQRDKVVEIWGWSEPDKAISLAFDKQSFSGKSDATGMWRIRIAAQKAGGPYTLELDGDGKATINDVYFGDVWLAGGQSNMELKLSWGINHSDQIIKQANYPLIRFFEVENKISETPKQDLTNGNWLQATPESAANFSAIGYLFALKNHQEKGVAVGIIDNNWGGTPAEAWLSKGALLKLPAYREKTEQLYKGDIDWPTLIAENDKNATEFYRRLNSKEDALKTGAYRFDYPVDGWTKQRLPNTATFDDEVWLRREVTLDSANKDEAILEFGDLSQEAFIWVNEKLVAQEDWKTHGSRHVLAPGILRKGQNLITIRVGDSWDNQPSAGTEGKVYLQTGDQKIDLSDDWLYSNTVEPPLPKTTRFEWTPSFLYNAMIHPIQGYGLRGVIWYQGESNTGQAAQYGDLFAMLIQDWRTQWRDNFSFLFVQLAGFLEAQNLQPDSQWALLRDMQAQALSLPDTGMATAIDIGEQDNIHPLNKQDVAARLWGEARRVSFHEKVSSQGPTYRSHSIKGKVVSVTFDHAGKQLKLKEGTMVKGFIIAGADGIFHVAKAKVTGKTVQVWSDKVTHPSALKYAWADFPLINLYNHAGLPALPFQVKKL